MDQGLLAELLGGHARLIVPIHELSITAKVDRREVPLGPIINDQPELVRVDGLPRTFPAANLKRDLTPCSQSIVERNADHVQELGRHGEQIEGARHARQFRCQVLIGSVRSPHREKVVRRGIVNLPHGGALAVFKEQPQSGTRLQVDPCSEGEMQVILAAGSNHRAGDDA